MAHLPDGVLSLPVLLGGGALAVAGCAVALKRLTPERIPAAGLLAAVFFIAGLVHFPVGPASVHLLLNGLVGAVLGWLAFPAICAALLLQLLFFGFGGLASLGVNLVIMAGPAVASGAIFAYGRRRGGVWIAASAGLAGGLGVALTAGLVCLCLALSGREFLAALPAVLIAHAPVMAIEAVFTAAALGLALRVKPDLFDRWAEEGAA